VAVKPRDGQETNEEAPKVPTCPRPGSHGPSFTPACVSHQRVRGMITNEMKLDNERKRNVGRIGINQKCIQYKRIKNNREKRRTRKDPKRL
jgi:hypothetical protein